VDDGGPARLFVAATLPGDVVAALQAARRELERAGVGRLRWVRPERLHLTLRFLGSTPMAKVAGVEAALRQTAHESAPMRLGVDGWGTFGGRRPRVVWAGLSGEIDELRACAARLEQRLVAAGFEEDGRAFRPHLTIARVPDRAGREERARVAAAVEAITPPEHLGWRIEELHLVRSHLGPGARYETLASFPLAGSRA
ncbi:MAG: RNA 2',3'-cyclic phosphodiesterase, partial [Gammaproteobacteria bacterium]|nr:RNA 2',3'-cyclic phosphodiesterase [Gammaproteobacteria bacterium]